MRHKYVISLVLLVIFISPMLSNNGTILSSENGYSGFPESMSDYVNSADPYSGTGPSLPVSLSGIATDPYGGVLQIDSSTSDIHTITLADGWSGSNLQTTIDSLSVDISDALVNPTLSDYHSEKWLVGASATYRAQNVIVPDGWTLVKNELDEDPHPHTGDWESNYYATGGYGGSPGFRFTGDIDSTSDPSDEIYHSQLVNAPYREIYSVEISFRYNVVNTGSTSSEMFLFLRFAGIEKTFYVFEPGDTTGSWLQETVILTSEDLQLISLPDSLLLDIGMGTDYTGSVSPLYFDAYIDDIDLTMNVRPFPEQIGLKVNGTSVIGATQGSIYPYVPDDSNRDAEDHFTNGIDLNGFDNNGNLFISGWGTDYLNIQTYDAGMQFPLSIPQGAVITSAYLEVEPTYQDGLVSVRVYAAGENLVGLPIENFITGLPHLEDQFNWVDTSIDWTVSSWTDAVRIRQRSPDIAPLIQSIVSDANWQDTNYVSLMLKYMWGSDSTSEFAIKGSSNYAQDEISRLFVEYMVPLPEDTVYFQQFEKDITISSSMTSATLTDFPVMIDITDTDLLADAQADGDDIIFKLGDEALDFEIEYFDKGTGRLIAWVKVPTLPATQNTIITMAYGNPNAGSSSSARVWDDFETVHHLAEDPSGTIYDSTANNHDGTSYGGLTSGNLVTGIGGNGINFDGTDDVISIGQIDTDEWSDFTMSVWFYHDISGDERVFSKSSSTGPQDHIITLRLDGGDIVNTRMKTDGTGGSGADAKSILTAATGAWHYVSWSWSASRHSIIAYLDGTPIIDSTLYGTSVFDENSVFVIGNNDLTNARFWDGLIDEARLTTSIRSEAWVDTEYNNQNNPSAYLSVGTKRTLQSTWVDAESTTVRFSTTSITPVDIFPIVTMDISGGGQTLDENMQDGTSYYVANDTVVEWTANVLVSPPADTASMNVVVDYPLTEWKPVTVTNPIGQVQTYGTDWVFHDGTVVILAAAVDIWGVWTIEFESWNYVYDMKMGPDGDSSYDSYSFNVGETAEFKVSSPWIENARSGLVLTDPTGSVWHTDYATTGAPGTTWDIPSFRYRMQLTVPNGQVDADVQNFPMLVNFADSDFTTDVQADGDDFVFVQSGNVLAHEIDRFEQSTGRLVAWVRANLSRLVDNTFWLYYGNPVIGSTESPETLWSNDYEAVWLMNEDFTDEGTSGQHIDSTSNSYVGLQNGNSQITGIANGFAQNFDGNDWISINATENLEPTGDVTISGWFYLGTAWSAASTPSQILVSKFLDINDDFHIALVGADYLEAGVDKGTLVFGFEMNAIEYVSYTYKNSWDIGWYHFACVMDADAPSLNKIYINGEDDTGGTVGSAPSVNLAFNADWGIGGRYGETSEFPTGESFFTGGIDEIRITSGIRSPDWINMTYLTVNNYDSFIDSTAGEQTRTSPEHTIDYALPTSAPAGLWTASFYYNDTGASVSYKTGLYERNFIVKHDTSLAIVNPTDAIVDHSTYAVAGDILYIELELTDDENAALITGASVTMNWSVYGAPTELTLNEIGNGRYGKSVNTGELSDEGQYRVNFNSYHQHYNNGTDYLNITLYHATELDYTDVDSTPVGFDFTATLVFTDLYDFSNITGAEITFLNGTPVNYVEVSEGRYNISFSTGSLSYGNHVYTFRAIKAGAFIEEGQVTVTFTLRKHFTAVSVTGDFLTPFGEVTPVSIEIIDLDTGLPLVTTSSINSWSFTSSNAPISETNPSDFAIDLTTGGWLVTPSETVTLTVSMGGIYYNPSQHQFVIEIRKHHTTVAVIGNLITPYGDYTSLTLVIIDTDTGLPLTFAAVSSFTFTPSSYGVQGDPSPSDLIFVLDTSAWNVTVGENVTLSVVMSGNYNNPANYDFDIEIRNHHTSVTVLGDLTTPYGQSTTLTLIITDTDTGLPLTVAAVSSFTFTPSSYGAQSDPSPSDLIFLLDTSAWSVATETVTLSVVMSGNYNNPANYDFDIIIRNHFTTLTVSGGLNTPYGFSTPLTIVITDMDTGTTLSSSDVASFLLDPASYSNHPEASPSDLDVNLDTTSWAVATETVTLSVIMTGNYENPTNYLFDIVIRNHRTSITVSGNLVTAYGETTSLTIIITDSDTGGTVSAGNVASFLLNPASYSDHSESNPSDLIVNLDTSSWSVATETVTLSVVMTGSYDSPSNYQFNIQIRNHLTSVTVIGNLETPYGNVTPLTIVITDLDLATTLSASDVAAFSFISGYGAPGEASPVDLLYDLDTSTWVVGGESVILSIVMNGNYQNPLGYGFTIIIRPMTTSIINEPNDLRFPTGADFKIVVVVTVTEHGTSYGNPVTGMLQAEFAIRNSTHTIPIKAFFDLTTGRYNLTIDASYFPEGAYTIFIRVTPANNAYATSEMTLVFEYTPARSELSSPDRSAVTPYDTDFVVTLTFLDIDRDQGITGAIITALGITIYNQVDLGLGVYQVTIDVSGLAKGEHLYDLTADQIGYEAQTISFKVIIRIAFAYAIPSVGALDIPVGDDPVFFVQYWDIDHDLPITDGGSFLATSNWNHTVLFTYIPLEERYRVTFYTFDDDALVQNYIVSFNFSKGENYQFGLFNISVTIRTHNTDFRLVSAVEPVSYTDNITISVFYGDIDSGTGIASEYVSYRVWNGTVNVLSYLYNVTGQGGYYTIIVPAQQFGGLGLQSFTVFFNWTGPVSTYTDSYLFAAANIVGEDSRLTLLVTAEPTPYLENMEYTLFYSAVNGTGITNITNNVYVSVEFVGQSVDLGQVTIWEVNSVTDPGKYSIRFNTTLFSSTGLIYMKVFINWAKGIEPFYSNRTDTISVRILARDTLVSISPPIQTAYDVNATFSFTFDDVTGALNDPIANDAKLLVTTSLADYSITYDGPSRTFTISFDTLQFGALGIQTFTLDVVWTGSPFYANQTGRSVSVTVIDRQTVLYYQAPSPTQYLDTVTFSITWTDVVGASTGITGATITLYEGLVPISGTYYSVVEIGSGVYSVTLNTTYKANPGTYNIKVNITSADFFYFSREDTRSLTIRYRSTITSSEPVSTVPYSSSFTAILYYQDIITLNVIGNGTSQVTFDILNGSSWIYTIEWKESLGYYELIVETSNQPTLAVGSTYSLHINMSFSVSSPFYDSDDAYITFEIRSRASSLERQTAPVPTPYLDNVTFTVYYSDADDGSPITADTINILKGITPLTDGIDYTWSNAGGGVFQISVSTLALDGLGVTSITVQAIWSSDAPYHDNAEVDINLTTTERTTNVEIVTPPSQTYYLEDVVFVVSFLDLGTGTEIAATKDLILILNGGIPLAPAQFTMTEIGATLTYEIRFSSTVLDSALVVNRILTVSIDWPSTPNYYKDDSTSTSVTTISRNTYVSVDRPGNTPYGENATFTFAFIDSTTLPEVLVGQEVLVEMSIVTNLTENPSLSYDVGTQLFTMSFNTAQFGDVGLAGFYINITWAGIPFYANKTLQIVYVTVTMRQTQVNYDAPAPTPFSDTVTFDVSYIDISGPTDVGIPDAVLTIYYLGAVVPGGNYILTPDGSGNFEIQFDTDFFSQPGYYNLNVSLTYTGGYFRNDASAVKTLNVRYRTTILSANPVGQIGYETTLEIVLSFQDILTLTDIEDTFATFAILNDTGTSWNYNITWQPASGTYLLVISTVGQTTLTLGDHTLWLNMSYAHEIPFYRWDDLYVDFTIRTRTSALDLQEAAIPSPFGENISFVVYYWDADVTEGIPVVDFVLNSGALLEGDDFFVVEDGLGVYTIYIDSSALGALGTYVINVEAVWPGGAPYHNNATRNVSVKTVSRTATVDILEPANQPRFLDNLVFTFAFVDAINGGQITIVAGDVSIYAGGILLTQDVEYTLTPDGLAFIVTINSTELAPTLVKDLNVTVLVDWDVGTNPFYTDDSASMKVTTIQRIILVEPQQIETTPVNDLMNITFFLIDEDNGNPVSNATILFRCVNPAITLTEGNGLDAYTYTLNETIPGEYTISVNTDWLVDNPDDLGYFIFELEVQWNASNSPYYRNKSPIKLTGAVDLILANMQSSVQTPIVQFTDDVVIHITLRDIDHLQNIDNESILYGEINVQYYDLGIIPDSLIINYLGSGVFFIKFGTDILNITNTYSMNITIDVYPYTIMTISPSFTATQIDTDLTAAENEIIKSWTEVAKIVVEYNDTLNLNLISNATLTWTYGLVNGTFAENMTSPGTYYAYINTSLAGTGTEFVTIRAEKDRYYSRVTTVALIVLALPSDIVLIDTGSPDVDRGESISFSIRLNDTERDIWINNLQVETFYATFEGVQYDLAWDEFSSTWNGTIPGSATVIDPGSYEVRFTVTFKDYQTAGDQFRISIIRTGSELTVRDYNTGALLFDIEEVYSQIVRFSVNLTEFENNTLVSDALIYWYSSDFNGLNLTFTYNSTTQLWDLEFNTTLGFYGTWGLTIRAIPTNPVLAPATATLTLTISKITTEVWGPTLTTEVDWGWTGNISFTYYDTAFDRGITNATVLYDYGPFTDLHANPLGNGTYLMFIDTTYLSSNAQYRIIVDLQKDNFVERTSGANLFVQIRSTELIVSVPDERTWESSNDETDLEIPMGDTLNVTFFYNDISLIGGLSGGLASATIQATLSATPGTYLLEPLNVTGDIISLGNGWYSFIFDTNDLTLYETTNETRIILNGQFFLSIHMEYLHRGSQDETVYLRIITTQSNLERDEQIVDPDIDFEYNITNGQNIVIDIYYNDTWHNVGVEGAIFQITMGATTTVSNSSLGNGFYRVIIQAIGYGGDSVIHITLSREFYNSVEINFLIHAQPNDVDTLFINMTTYGLPFAFAIILLLGAYVKVWSVPKRIRQIDGQIKRLRKGKMPKPIMDSKSRQELVSELFNDTFAKLEITRTAADMPDAAIPIDVPEIRELLVQLAILTHLNQEELDEFNADISKMKMSEQAAFVKEVIVQEAIRAARAQGKTVEEILEEVAGQASRKLSDEDEIEEIIATPEEPVEERVFLVEEEEVKLVESETEVEVPVEEETVRSEKLSSYEIDELKTELIKKGVPNHEIDMIIEQARQLSRELVEELVKSLGLRE